MNRAMHLAWPDLAVIAAYLIGIVGLGLLAWKKRRSRTGGSAEYFLAGGTLGWGVIGLALFSTNISTIHLVSLAQEGYVNGLAYGKGFGLVQGPGHCRHLPDKKALFKALAENAPG